ncbi:16S rRNA (cytosine(1402)-N(4))-methyltransferase [archaeon]|nr:16S rRNA (cytosine(1402)-N(4))-methyltransferase [archaeon]|tara:strand:+ start:3438 stop:4133 length:696 start_codon:yes stop_codon:yes gene_type:complete
MSTNVKAEELNYDKYENKKYDDDIRRVIPGHEKLHQEIEKIVKEFSQKNKVEKIADLGVGTGLTAERILKIIPQASLTAVDFSEVMLSGAKKRLSKYQTKFILGDYAKEEFGKDFDIIESVIGIHHQNHEGKRKLFKKIFNSLKDGGIFIFGDLVTYKDEHVAKVNDEKHYAFLVKNATDKKTLEEWTHHHKFLNDLAPIEDQVNWLKEAGFSSVDIKFQELNTALILAQK